VGALEIKILTPDTSASPERLSDEGIRIKAPWIDVDGFKNGLSSGEVQGVCVGSSEEAYRTPTVWTIVLHVEQSRQLQPPHSGCVTCWISGHSPHIDTPVGDGYCEKITELHTQRWRSVAGHLDDARFGQWELIRVKRSCALDSFRHEVKIIFGVKEGRLAGRRGDSDGQE